MDCSRLVSGAEKRNRTPDLLITNELLYRLSYFGVRMNYSVSALPHSAMVA